MQPMRHLIIITIISFLTISCIYEKSDITDDMKIGLISFSQETIGFYPNLDNSNAITQDRANGVLTITYITEETGCPIFEGGYKVSDNTLMLYYQDIDFQAVKCIGLFKLEYQIKDDNLHFDNIKTVRLNPIKKDLDFRTKVQ